MRFIKPEIFQIALLSNSLFPHSYFNFEGILELNRSEEAGHDLN